MFRAFAGIALGRLRRRSPLNLAQGLGLALAVALSLTIAITQSVAAEAGLATTLAGAAPRTYVTVERTMAPDPAAYAAFEDEIAARVRGETGTILEPGARYQATSALRPLTLNGGVLAPPDPSTPLPSLASYEDLERHADLTGGAWPVAGRAGDAWPVSVSAAGADLLAVHVGDVLCMAVPGQLVQRICARIDGLWRPRDPGEHYWGVGVPLISLMLPQQSFPPAVRTVPSLPARAGAVFWPVLGRIHLDNAAATATAINRLRGRFAAGRGDSFATGLDLAIQDYLAVSRSRAVSVQLVTAQAIAVAVYFVAVAAGIVLAGQRQVFEVWRGRGWSMAGIWWLLMSEHAVLLLAATVARVAVAWAAASVVARAALHAPVPAPRAFAGQLAMPLLATVAAMAAVLAIQSWRAVSLHRVDVRSEAPRRANWWRRGSIDLWAGAAALLYLVAVLVGRASLGGLTDIALPALAAVVLAVAGLRALPAAARLVDALGSLAARLAAQQLLRRTAETGRLALLVAFAVALGVFASAYAGTTARGVQDTAAYQAGGDVRAWLSDSAGPPRLDELVGGLPDVSDAAMTFRDQGLPAGSFVYQNVLGVEPESLERVLASRTEAPGRPPSDVLRMLSGADAGPALPEGGEEAQRLALAIALANGPRLLLADEPTAELDGPSARRLLDDVGYLLRETRTGAILVEHDQHVERHVDRVIRIRDGRTSTETRRWGAGDGDGVAELVIMDRAGRLQVPAEYVERLGLRDRVRMVLESDHIRILPTED